jgi:hypothetical protein
MGAVGRDLRAELALELGEEAVEAALRPAEREGGEDRPLSAAIRAAPRLSQRTTRARCFACRVIEATKAASAPSSSE